MPSIFILDILTQIYDCILSNGDIYNSNVRVEFLRRIREERRFASLEELRRQIEKDVASINKI